jgi:hypothetical protein
MDLRCWLMGNQFEGGPRTMAEFDKEEEEAKKRIMTVIATMSDNVSAPERI